MRVLGRIALWVALAFCLPVSAFAQSPQRSVLIFDQSEPNAPWGLAVRAAIRSALSATPGVPLAVYSEILDLGRFGNPEYEELQRRYLREKYREKPIGAIIVHGAAALEMLLRLRTELWSTTPVVFAAVDEATVARLNPPPDVTGLTFQLTLRNVVISARAVAPGLKKIALVGDPWERQPFRRHFKQEIAQFTPELEFIDLAGLPMTEIRARVAALPEDTVIYYTAIYVDDAGVTYIARDALPMVAETGNRPIVSDTETHIGYGSTGGIVALPAPVGAEAARLALRILNGESASQIPVTTGNFVKPIFDWRQMQRWNVSKSMLPPGSEIRFRPPGLWDQYRWQMSAVIAAILLQAAMIAGLLIERDRRRRAEIEARGRLLQLAHLNRTATAGALSASIAHELNQPLGAILSNTEAAEALLKAGRLDSDLLRDILADIRKADQRAGDIIRRLRGLLKKAEIERQPIDLNGAIDDTVGLLHADAAEKGIALNSENARRSVYVQADPVHLQQVLLNLATNALDAMAGSSSAKRVVTFQTALVNDSSVEVSVADNGTGIPRESLGSIFQPFVTSKQKGMGLGLSIVRTIVEAYGGKIWAENRPTGGAVFRFTLPLAARPPA